MIKNVSRRGFIYSLGGTLTLPFLFGKKAEGREVPAPSLLTSGGRSYVPVITPGIPTLKYKMVSGVKVFELTAEPVTVQFPDMMGMQHKPIYTWGYNGSMPGPTIEVVEGDTVRILFKNNLPDPTTVHWHGLHIPINMDGVPDISQKPVPPGGSFVYEFTLEQSGTYFYHSHVMQAKQIGLGLMGFFIVHPKNPTVDQRVDRDYAYFLHMWKIDPDTKLAKKISI